MSNYGLIVCQANIANFRALLVTSTDEAQSKILRTLLAEELVKEVAELEEKQRAHPVGSV